MFYHKAAMILYYISVGDVMWSTLHSLVVNSEEFDSLPLGRGYRSSIKTVLTALWVCEYFNSGFRSISQNECMIDENKDISDVGRPWGSLLTCCKVSNISDVITYCGFGFTDKILVGVNFETLWKVTLMSIVLALKC